MGPQALLFPDPLKIVFGIFMMIYVITFHPWVLVNYIPTDGWNDPPTLENEALHYKEAIFTVISSELYLPALLLFGHTLKIHGASEGRDLLAFIPHKAITQQRQLEMIKEVGFTPVFVDAITLPGATDWKFVDMLVKLYAWNYTQYDIIALIDSDVMLLGDIELPFQLMRMGDFPLAACIAPTTPSPPFYDKLSGHFNAGVMFIRPNVEDFKELIRLSSNTSYYDIGLAEQSLLNEFYHGKWLGLPLTYNLIIRFRDREDIWHANRASAKIIHFAGGHKPWNRFKKEQLIADDFLWRDIFIELYPSRKWVGGEFKLYQGFAGI
eukprot:TRINITY_DN4224_c0_g1_i2.p1 TRINITY_DN4224_c0_g1~~TRINITY_DN4224_c0_g1_i2.p1  ORF type:complete len:323 (-),score=42.34 TRINITY_DN4224_c0_g1_i2:47-1015(-)